MKYTWPGNVRELQNLLEGTIQIYNDIVITMKHIKQYFNTDMQLYDESTIKIK
nr:hypothetical protein [Clostridium sp.]